jgi:cysteine desulfurase
VDVRHPSLRQPAGVLAVQLANPVVGTVQPLADLAAAGGDAPLFVDACAAAGRLPLPEVWGAAALSAHKWGGPAGVGVLLVRKGARWRAAFPTDDRVDPRVAGFENVAGALAAAAALQARVAERDQLNERHAGFAAQVRAALADVPDVEVHGDPDRRLPHLVSFSCLYVDGEALVGELDRRGLSVASGSACTASALEPSHVLVAMGALTHGNVRVTFSRGTSRADVAALCDALPDVVASLRARITS